MHAGIHHRMNFFTHRTKKKRKQQQRKQQQQNLIQKFVTNGNYSRYYSVNGNNNAGTECRYGVMGDIAWEKAAQYADCHKQNCIFLRRLSPPYPWRPHWHVKRSVCWYYIVYTVFCDYSVVTASVGSKLGGGFAHNFALSQSPDNQRTQRTLVDGGKGA